MLEYYSNRDALCFLGDEDNLMEIAGNWSLNPQLLEAIEIENVCFIFKRKK